MLAKFSATTSTLRAFAMETDALTALVVQVAAANDKHDVDAQLLGVLNLRLDRIVAEVGAHAELRGEQFVRDVLRAFDRRGELTTASLRSK